MTAPTFRILTDCQGCGRETPSSRIQLGVGSDGPVLRIEELGKVTVPCVECHLIGSVDEPGVRFERMEVDE